MNDCVQSYHVNPYTCGVAKWNLRLATELGVPFVKLGTSSSYPLISVKPSEVPPRQYPQFKAPYDLILHGWPPSTTDRDRRWVMGADRIWTVAPQTAEALSALRPDVAILPCPATITTPRPRAAHTYLTFGMAHKTAKVLRHYEAFRDELGDQEYTILLSMGVHEGSPWDQTLESSAAALRQIFGEDRVEVLGFLSDAALHREMDACTACVAFYDPAFRANNTTAWAVLERGKRLITNCDACSPDPIAPTWPETLRALGSMSLPRCQETQSEYPTARTDPPVAPASALPSPGL